MLETERSSDEALRQATYRRLYLGACRIEDYKKSLEACYIILLAGRLGLRTGEVQHVREEWIDWMRGEIAIPQHDPCGCMNCWVRAKQKANADEDELREEMREVVERRVDSNTERDTDEIVDELLAEDDEPPTEKEDEDDEDNNETNEDGRTAEEILYEERWEPKYKRSARRVPFGHSERLIAVIMEYLHQYDYMEITQVTMNNRVQRAAELADGVDPENLTIRGLRATAATHYATYIRNPKALQDLLGWTRIETGAQYIRRAGGFTTDIVYTAFEKTDLKPVMYPEEPEAEYPLLTNSMPYQNEPVDPAAFGYPHCKDRADTTAGDPRGLIHPRSQNPPNGIDYDPEKHKILTHDDLESDIVEDIDGRKAIKEPTLDEFIDDQGRMRADGSGELDSQRQYESMAEYKAKAIPRNPADILWGGDEDQSSAKDPVLTFLTQYTRLGFALANKVRAFIGRKFSRGQEPTSPDRVERRYGTKTSASESEPPVPWIYRASFVFTILTIAFSMLVFIAVRTNNYWNPFTGEWNLSGAMAVALLVVGYIVFKLAREV